MIKCGERKLYTLSVEEIISSLVQASLKQQIHRKLIIIFTIVYISFFISIYTAPCGTAQARTCRSIVHYFAFVSITVDLPATVNFLIDII